MLLSKRPQWLKKQQNVTYVKVLCAKTKWMTILKFSMENETFEDSFGIKVHFNISSIYVHFIFSIISHWMYMMFSCHGDSHVRYYPSQGAYRLFWIILTNNLFCHWGVRSMVEWYICTLYWKYFAKSFHCFTAMLTRWGQCDFSVMLNVLSWVKKHLILPITTLMEVIYMNAESNTASSSQIRWSIGL